MKYKHVFLIWLYADLFLAGGLMCFMMYEGGRDATEMFFLIAAYGIGISLPSLIAMLLFHWAYTENAKDKIGHKPYIFLIIGINILYLLIGQFAIGMTGEFNVFYIGSTLAGLLSFYLVDRKIKKAALAVTE